MEALVLTADGPGFDPARPFVPRPHEAQIRTTLGGVCATDLELIQGYMGFTGVMGHEWVGVVEAAEDPTWVGRRVVGDINCPCGQCPTCAQGRGNHCPHRTVLGIVGRDGAFATRLSLPLANLHPVPDSVTDDAAVFVEPLAAACRILEQVHVLPNFTVIVLGVGRLGQLCARVLALTGARVIGVGRSARRLSLLPEGIERSTAPDRLPRADLVVDCTGAPGGLEQAGRLVKAGGTIVLKTTVHEPFPVSPTPWVIDEVTVIGSRCGPFEPALRLLASGAVDPRPLISGRYPLHEGVAALRAAAQPDHIKVVLQPAP